MVAPPDGAPRGRALLAVGLLLALVALTASRALAARAGAGPDRVQLYVAVPADVPINYGLADRALHETDLAIGWLEQQVGRQLDGGDVRFAEIVTIDASAASLVGDVETAFDTIHGQILSHAGDDAVFPIVLADVRTEHSDTGFLTCGLGGTRGLVMFLGNCPGDEPSTTSVWGSAASFTIAHELVHGLGAADPCGRSATGDGHVTDDPNDIIFAGVDPRGRTGGVTLDAGHDDYFDHDRPGCHDIADSPLWAGD